MTCAHDAVAILKRVTLRVAVGHAPRSSLSPADQQFVIQSSHMKIYFTCATVTGYLHLDEGSEKFQHGMAPVLDDIGRLVRV